MHTTISERVRRYLVGMGKWLLAGIAVLVIAWLVRAFDISETTLLWIALLAACAYLGGTIEDLKFEIFRLNEELKKTKEEHEEWLKRLGQTIHQVAKDAGQKLF